MTSRKITNGYHFGGKPPPSPPPDDYSRGVSDAVRCRDEDYPTLAETLTISQEPCKRILRWCLENERSARTPKWETSVNSSSDVGWYAWVEWSF